MDERRRDRLLRVEPTQQLQAYLPVTEVWATSQNQRLRLHSLKLPATATDALELEVFSVCSTDDDLAERGLAPGRHTVQIHAAVAGASSTLPPVTVQVELTCSAAAQDAGGDAAPLADSGAMDAGTLVASADAAADAAVLPPPPERKPDGGCSVGFGSEGRGVVVTGVALLGLLLRLGRRRHAHARRP